MHLLHPRRGARRGLLSERAARWRAAGGRPAQTALVEIECVGSAGDDSESGEEL